MVIGISNQKSDEKDNYNIQKFVVKELKKQHILNGCTDFPKKGQLSWTD